MMMSKNGPIFATSVRNKNDELQRWRAHQRLRLIALLSNASPRADFDNRVSIFERNTDFDPLFCKSCIGSFQLQIHGKYPSSQRKSQKMNAALFGELQPRKLQNQYICVKKYVTAQNIDKIREICHFVVQHQRF